MFSKTDEDVKVSIFNLKSKMREEVEMAETGVVIRDKEGTSMGRPAPARSGQSSSRSRWQSTGDNRGDSVPKETCE